MDGERWKGTHNSVLTIAGYRDVLNTIHESQDYISIRPNMILQLHRDLYKFEGYDIGGKYKAADNIIEEEDEQGNKRSGKASKKTGKHGYYTQCWNFWKDGICPKKNNPQAGCGECQNQRYKELTGQVLYEHLVGAREDASDVIGLYPMFPDETVNFLVFDFDCHDDKIGGDDGANLDSEWMTEVNAFRKICENNDVPVLVERSRSGKGAHIWMFFEKPIK